MAGGLPTDHHHGCDEGHTEPGELPGEQVASLNGFVPLRSLLNLSPRAGRGRFASAALAERSKSGEGAFPQPETRGHAPSPGFLRSASLRLESTSPRMRGEVGQVAWPVLLPAGSGFACRLGLGPLLGLEILAGLLVDDLHGQAHLAALVEAQELDLDLVAFLDDVGHLLHAARRELADVHEPVLGAEEVHERTEVDDLHHRAVVDVTDLWLGGDRLDPVDRRLDGLALGGRDLDGAIVLDVDLGAGLLHDLADHLAARADHFADLVGRDLHRLDAWRMLTKLIAAMADRL